MAKSIKMHYAEKDDPIFTGKFIVSKYQNTQGRKKVMGKIISESWVEKDDPMFTGRFNVHSVRAKDPVQNKKKKNAVKTVQKSRKK
tara:strand:- start:49 stop:306 length:258 start_codon:yes stop_codon:yes gene_type:complete